MRPQLAKLQEALEELNRLHSPRVPRQLVCMRLRDMRRVHRQVILSERCSVCQETVGIYPSGHKFLLENVLAEIVCQQCHLVEYAQATKHCVLPKASARVSEQGRYTLPRRAAPLMNPAAVRIAAATS